MAFTFGFVLHLFNTAAGATFRPLDYLLLPLMTLALATLITNSAINLNLLTKYYPNHLPSRKLQRAGVVLFILTLLIIVLNTILAVTLWIQIWGPAMVGNTRILMIVGIVTGVSLTGIYILWNQVSLRKMLRRNYEISMETFLSEEQTPP
jgi:hypothetical protein